MSYIPYFVLTDCWFYSNSFDFTIGSFNYDTMNVVAILIEKLRSQTGKKSCCKLNNTLANLVVD